MDAERNNVHLLDLRIAGNWAGRRRRPARYLPSHFPVNAIICAHMTMAAGTKLGPYTVEAHIGAGGMGEVFRASDSRLGRDVAFHLSWRPGCYTPSNVVT